MNELLTFGQSLSEMMQSHSITATALATRLGMSGSTPISRLLRDQTSPARMEEFCEMLSRDDTFLRSEVTRLREAIAVSRLGKSAFIAQQAIHELIFGSTEDIGEALMENGTPLSTYLQRFVTEGKLTLICFGCCDPAVFKSIAPLFEDGQRRVELSHYVNPNADTRNHARVIQAVGALFFDRRYQLYVTSTSEQGTDSFFFLPSLLLVSGGQNEALLALRENHSAVIVSYTRHGSIVEAVRAMIGRITPAPRKVERDNTLVANLRDDLFLRYQREKNRVLCHLRPEPGFLMMPVDVLTELFDATDSTMKDPQLRRQVLAILKSRERELRKPNRHHTMVFSREATLRFFQTGMSTDPLKGMPPFNPGQRKRILEHMLSLVHDAPAFSVRFLLPDKQLKNYQIAYFEGKGVLVNHAHQIYSTDGGARELLITDLTFRQQYRNYFEGMLLPEFTYSAEESARMLEDMRGEIT